MSMHKIPLTDVERTGLQNHGLPVGKPSQLSDVFRQGVAHGSEQAKAAQQAVEQEREVFHLINIDHVEKRVEYAKRITDLEAALRQCVDALKRCTKYELADCDAITKVNEVLK